MNNLNLPWIPGTIRCWMLRACSLLRMWYLNDLWPSWGVLVFPYMKQNTKPQVWPRSAKWMALMVTTTIHSTFSAWPISASFYWTGSDESPLSVLSFKIRKWLGSAKNGSQSSHHCRFVARTNIKLTVYTAGSSHKPALILCYHWRFLS
jgi:hypothetical protein